MGHIAALTRLRRRNRILCSAHKPSVLTIRRPRGYRRTAVAVPDKFRIDPTCYLAAPVV